MEQKGEKGEWGRKKGIFLFKPTTTLSTGSLLDAITSHTWLSILLPFWCICREKVERMSDGADPPQGRLSTCQLVTNEPKHRSPPVQPG